MKITLVIPAYNEEKRLRSTIRAVGKYFSGKDWDYELIVVDDGSRDGTAQVVREEWRSFRGTAKVLLNDRNRGKGYSVRRGMLEAEGDFLFFSDADLSTPIEEMEKLLGELENGCDVAVGSRDMPGSRVEIHQSWVRETMGRIFNLIARALTFHSIRDSQCGFKGFRRDAARFLFNLQRINGFAFDAEILFLAQKYGLRVKEMPVLWRNSPTSKVRIFWDPLKMMAELIGIRIYHLGHEKKSV